MISYVLAVVCAVLILAADQLTKYLVTQNLAVAQSAPFIPGLFRFTHVENGGAAWGFLSGHTWILLSLTIVVILICFALLIQYGLKSKIMFWSVSLILAGGVGNMIDRIFRGGTVVDFLDCCFLDFPVFNVADCAIVIGSLLLALYFLKDVINEIKDRRN